VWTPSTSTRARLRIEEICRGLKVFPQLVGFADKTATFQRKRFCLAPVIHTLGRGPVASDCRRPCSCPIKADKNNAAEEDVL